MRIKKNTRTVFIFPTGFIINSFTAGTVRRKLKKEGINLTKKQTLLIIKELRRYKENHVDWNLVEVTRKNGDTALLKI